MTASTPSPHAAQAGSARRAGVFHPEYALISVALVALITVIAFEGMAVSTAMPDVARELDAVRSYGLAFSVMLTAQLLGIVLAGVSCDRSGPLPSLYAGQLLFGVGCLTAVRPRALAPSSPGARSAASGRA